MLYYMDDSVRGVVSDTRVRWGVIAVLFLLAAFLLVTTIGALKGLRYIGGGVPVTNTVTVSGEGEVFAVPDIATFTFGVIEPAETVEVAQEAATEKINAVVAYLQEQGIAEEDIRTIGYNVYPRYEYTQGTCTQFGCPPGRQELIGFEVSQSVEVKVRDPQKAGELLAGVGARGANNVSGLSFTVDDENELQRQAREQAIADARAKAEQLAEDLNVDLVRVVSFGESGDMPYPVYYGKEMAARGGVGMDAAASAPAIPTGENRIVMNVSITYEIR